MKIAKNKTLAIAIATFFMLSLAASVSTNLTTGAHTPPFTIPTYAYVSVQPNPVGVGQAASVNFWIDKVPPTANQAWGDRWENYMVKVTHPDGTVENLGPFESDAAGGAHTWYTPSTIGNYTFVFSFPGQTLAGYNLGPGFTNASYPNVGDYYAPSTSPTYVLTVQEEASPLLPTNPLPTGYWQRPIFANNLAWYTISGNWLGGGGAEGGGSTKYNSTSNFAPYTTAPNTAHIVWTKPYAPGGLMGGEYGGNQMNSNFYSTAQYESKFAGVVINGVLYYTREPGASTSYMGWEAIDLRTGKTIWWQNQSATTRLMLGQIYDYVSPNQYGGLAYLWSLQATVAPNTGSTFGMYDAMTGGWILNIVNATTPTWAYGPSGELLGYYINSTSKTLNMWNSSRCILIGQNPQQVAVSTETNWMWRPPQGAQLDFKLGIQWAKPLKTTMTADNGTTVDINAYYAEQAGTTAYSMAISKVADVILVDNSGAGGRFQQPGYIVQEAYSPDTGDLLWGPTKQTIEQPWSRISISSIGQGVYTILTYETQTISAYSTKTGQKMWGPVSVVTPNNPWGYYVCISIIGYDKLFVVDFGGNVWCLNLATGAVLWKTSTNEASPRGVAGANTPYGVWTIVNILCLADGKLFTMGGHLYSPPLYNGGQLICFNATTGEMVWNDLSFAITNGGNAVLSDGYLVSPDAYDNQLYCYSKGQSAVTVSAPDVAVPFGTSVLIKGTVTDQSPGDTCLGIPAAGTPAISDASMTAWMEYLYQQQPRPNNATGVPVSIDVLDSNGNYRNIGTTTSDDNGKFSFTWTPDIPGDFTVIATFAGSESYYASYDETFFTVSDSGPTASPYPETVLPPTEMYFAISTVAIIIAIAIGFAVTILMLRKRP